MVNLNQTLITLKCNIYSFAQVSVDFAVSDALM